MTIIEAVATLFGIICVWLTVKQNIWCWPTGLIQVLLYIFVFYEAKLYSDVILHIFYVVINIYGWYHWLNGKHNKEELKVTIEGKLIGIWLILCVVGTFCWGHLMYRFTDASLPYLDSFIATASIFAQWLMAKKKLESWFFWIAVDIVAVCVYWIKGLYLTTGLYSIFLILATLGYFEWRKAYLNSKLIAETAYE